MRFITLFLVTMLLFVILLPSCSKSFCVKIDGSYEGKSGSVEYCYSPSYSSLINKPVFTSNDGKKSVLLNTDQIEQISTATPESKAKMKTILGGKN